MAQDLARVPVALADGAPAPTPAPTSTAAPPAQVVARPPVPSPPAGGQPPQGRPSGPQAPPPTGNRRASRWLLVVLTLLTVGVLGMFAMVYFIGRQSGEMSAATQMATPTATTTPAVTATAVPPAATAQPAATVAPQPVAPPATTALPTVAPTAAPPATTQVPTTVPAVTEAVQASVDPTAAHWARLEKLDQVFRSQGWEAWLKAAGVSWNTIVAEARQVEEETSPSSKIFASGVQVNGRRIEVNWPNVVTTDVSDRIETTATTVQYQPDARNASVMYTNVVVKDGPVTVWISGLPWGQFTSRLGIPVVAGNTSAT